MDTSVQEGIQDLITALIKSLGPNHGKLLSLMRNFPTGSESLALRVLNIFTENSRPTAPLVTLVKSLAAERDLDPRFLIPIIAEMDKVWIRHVIVLVDSHTENGLGGYQQTPSTRCVYAERDSRRSTARQERV